MKKLILSLVAVFALSFAVQAQDYDFTGGVRAGYGAAFSLEASGQAFVNDINRIELDLGIRFQNHLRTISDYDIYYHMGPILSTSYQWHWFLAGGFGFFGGPAVQVSIPQWNNFGLGLGGQLGFDYQFDAPFQIGFDFRPIYNVIGKFKGINVEDKTRILGGFDPGFGLSLRYAF